ncbi:MAG: hypothetical protein ACLGIA_09195, partial [Actinomycetes bacterium]
MDLTWLQPVVNGQGPFTSVHIDVSRETADAAHEVELRWQAVRRSLQEQGAQAEVLDDLEQTVLQQTGRAGEQGRSLVVGVDGVLLDRVVPRRPVRDSGYYGQIPHLMPLVRALDGAATYLLVETDRAGA